jgi:hypothetical protein
MKSRAKYLKDVERAVGRRLEQFEIALALDFYEAGKGCKTAAREILRGRNA